ncbi:hypothetical protein SDC9_204542 [bioreactor metagenome]|uniref:Uncharacterized protein n=1 Tax=bioreactor metagenome TaxID=1076179 RepID=A0A645J2B9_9ZZZZ
MTSSIGPVGFRNLVALLDHALIHALGQVIAVADLADDDVYDLDTEFSGEFGGHLEHPVGQALAAGLDGFLLHAGGGEVAQLFGVLQAFHILDLFDQIHLIDFVGIADGFIQEVLADDGPNGGIDDVAQP